MSYTEYLISLNYLLFLPFTISLFATGLLGIVFNQKDLLMLLLCIELMLLGISLTFLIFSLFQGNALGKIYALYVIALAGAESAIGLGLLAVAYNRRKGLSFSDFNQLRG